ncbi:beta-lactamase family protein [Deinococcus taeanensis]|uniref:serine hydrolase domain-containing protein n=1 Tax=Deinococcus taeanensis TaxID=2737050 RepID=UPI001CDC2D66|nr:serine hydrolase domain-containing protein [Deinococcus taeanensis]UBV42415.1 beta-lactamase family protein [Deinococcus taeanensis]
MFRRDPLQQAIGDLQAVLGGDLRMVRPALRAALAHGGVVGAARGPHRVVRGLGGVPEDGVFELASVSKPFTAALAGALVNAGPLSWDAPLSTLGGPLRPLPPFVTAWALATHTAGLPMHPARVGVTSFTHVHDPYGTLSPAGVVGSVRRWARPGGRFGYSNLGVGLLALACAHAAGEAFTAEGFGEALTRGVTRPVGLTVTLRPGAGLVVPRPGLLTGPEVTRFGPLAGAGGLFGRAEDLLTFGQASLSGAAGTLHLGLERPRGLPGGLDGVIPGWFARGALRWHDGVARGTRTGLGVNLESGVVVTVLVRGGVPVLGVRAAVPAALLGLLGNA